MENAIELIKQAIDILKELTNAGDSVHLRWFIYQLVLIKVVLLILEA